jgi:hypothetical protein
MEPLSGCGFILYYHIFHFWSFEGESVHVVA